MQVVVSQQVSVFDFQALVIMSGKGGVFLIHKNISFIGIGHSRYLWACSLTNPSTLFIGCVVFLLDVLSLTGHYILKKAPKSEAFNQ